jgi:hypothetical protein
MRELCRPQDQFDTGLMFGIYLDTKLCFERFLSLVEASTTSTGGKMSGKLDALPPSYLLRKRRCRIWLFVLRKVTLCVGRRQSILWLVCRLLFLLHNVRSRCRFGNCLHWRLDVFFRSRRVARFRLLVTQCGQCTRRFHDAFHLRFRRRDLLWVFILHRHSDLLGFGFISHRCVGLALCNCALILEIMSTGGETKDRHGPCHYSSALWIVVYPGWKNIGLLHLLESTDLPSSGIAR